MIGADPEARDPTAASEPAAEPGRATVQYPGGLGARYRWTGSGRGEGVFSLTEVGGTLTDHGQLVSVDPERLCRAELRVEGPLGTWTARFASLIYDEPQGTLWDTTGLLVVKYGFLVYALAGRTGELAWTYRSSTPILVVLGSSRLDHVIVQSEVETVALDASGRTVWRIAHADVVTGADLVAGRLVITMYAGAAEAFDPRTGGRLELG